MENNAEATSAQVEPVSEPRTTDNDSYLHAQHLRLECLKLAFADSNNTLEGGLEIASQMWAFVKGE